MGRNIYLLLALMIFVCFSSCEEKGSTVPSISGVTVPATAHFGDSIPFSLTADSKEDLSMITATIYYDGKQMPKQLFPVNNTGVFSGKLYMPYIADSLFVGGTASIRFSVRNRLYEFYDLPGECVVQLSYPDFPYLTLETGSGSVRMERVGSTSEYKATGVFPRGMTGRISSAPAGEWGNVIHFGYDGAIFDGRSEYAGLKLDSIKYKVSGTDVTEIFFDIAKVKAYPIPVIHYLSFKDRDSYILDIDQEEEIKIEEGFKDWWINPSFFLKDAKETDRTLIFQACRGIYKLVAEQPGGNAPKYLAVFPWDSRTDQPLAFDPATGNGAIWVNGATSIGIPSTSNAPQWNLAKSFAMAPKGNKIYEMQLLVGTNINSTLANFRLYGQYNSDSYIFTADPERIIIDSEQNLLYVANTFSENGNIRGRSSTAGPLTPGTIIITVDASKIPVVLSYKFK